MPPQGDILIRWLTLFNWLLLEMKAKQLKSELLWVSQVHDINICIIVICLHFS